MTNSERIEANSTAIRTVERTLAVHEHQITSLEDDVDGLEEGYLSTRELLGRMDERLKHVEQSVDRIWKLLLNGRAGSARASASWKSIYFAPVARSGFPWRP